jgi:hypothetical protein
MEDRMKVLENLKNRIMEHGHVADEQIAMDIARKWATA